MPAMHATCAHFITLLLDKDIYTIIFRYGIGKFNIYLIIFYFFSIYVETIIYFFWVDAKNKIFHVCR